MSKFGWLNRRIEFYKWSYMIVLPLFIFSVVCTFLYTNQSALKNVFEQYGELYEIRAPLGNSLNAGDVTLDFLIGDRSDDSIKYIDSDGSLSEFLSDDEKAIVERLKHYNEVLAVLLVLSGVVFMGLSLYIHYEERTMSISVRDASAGGIFITGMMTVFVMTVFTWFQGSPVYRLLRLHISDSGNLGYLFSHDVMLMIYAFYGIAAQLLFILLFAGSSIYIQMQLKQSEKENRFN